MYNKRLNLYPAVMEHYFNNKTSLRKTAEKFNLHYQTVYKWIKHYKKYGEKYLSPAYKKTWNRINPGTEHKIIQYKELIPGLTVKQAQKLLEKSNIRISWHGIYNVWQRYGYCGFKMQNMGNDFTEFINFTKETSIEFDRARILYETGKIKESAEILNKLPCLPKNDLLLKIPDELLNIRRRIEKLTMEFGKMPLPDYLKKAKELYNECLRQKLRYSALRIGMAILVALSWSGEPQEYNRWTMKIERLLSITGTKPRDIFPLYFTLLIGKCHSFVNSLKLNKAYETARYSLNLLKNHKNPSPNFLYDLAIQYIDLEDYVTAERLLIKANANLAQDRQKRIKFLLGVYIYLLRGEINTAKRLLNEAEVYDWTRNAPLLRFQALLSIFDGNINHAIELAQKSLNQSKTGELHLDLTNAYLAMATAYASLAEKNKSLTLLKDLLKFAKKFKLRRQYVVVKTLLKKIPGNKEILKLSTIKLAWLLKNKGYITALKYARKKGIIFYFYRYLFFYPEVVIKRINQGTQTYLPKSILKLPLFNAQAIVYRLNLLGKIIVFRNQKYTITKLMPKDSGLLVHLSLRIPNPGSKFNTNEIINNFWQKNPDANRILSHVLLRLKKELRIPGHLLAISRRYGESVLINEGIYFTTDYQEFEQTLARAKALERASEWKFAKREYLRAFKLFRGEPFKKNFDEWSLNMRHKILTQLETEAINFAKSCLEHGDKTTARKILQKVLKIIPDSEEIKNLLKL